MKKELICIVCPNGCELTVETDAQNTVLSVDGASCPKGERYAVQEMTNPMRTIASSILVTGGELPLASVRITKPVPGNRIFDVMAEIRKIVVKAPVEAGSIVIHSVLGYDSDVIVTKTVEVLP